MTAAGPLMRRLEALLPLQPPGISAREAHAEVDIYSLNYTSNLLRRLAAAKLAASHLTPGPGVQQTRRYWKAAP